MLAGALVLNLGFLRLLLFRWQVLVVCVELLALFYALVLSFDRDFGVVFAVGQSGVSNLYFLITTGAFTTIYISLIAIAIACVLALLGALGKLSRNGAAYAIATFYISSFRGTPLLMRSEEHTSELQSLMRISYAVFCLTKKTNLSKQITIYNPF